MLARMFAGDLPNRVDAKVSSRRRRCEGESACF